MSGVGGDDENMGGIPASPAATAAVTGESTTASTTGAYTDSSFFQQLLNLGNTGAPQLGPGVPTPAPGVPQPAAPGVSPFDGSGMNPIMLQMLQMQQSMQQQMFLMQQQWMASSVHTTVSIRNSFPFHF